MKKDIQNEAKELVAYEIPAVLLNNIVNFLAQNPWIKVNELINSINNSITPIYAENVENETKN